MLAAFLLLSIAPKIAFADSEAWPLLAQIPRRKNLALLGMQFFIAAWVFVLGSCFGSFLNVVIYRLPAGMSLGKPKSRCPRCETSLAAKDNIPVFGWMLLKGKCRYCSLPIAPRYPIIESTCGLIFLSLMFGELLTGAANLPLRHPDHFHVHPGFWLVWFAKWDLSGIYFFHCCMLVVVLATVMIGYDGHRPQRKLLTFGLVVALVCGMMWPQLRPVPAAMWPQAWGGFQAGFVWQDLMEPPNRYWTGVTLLGLLDGLVGVLLGLLFGSLIRLAATARTAVAADTNFLANALLHVFLLVGAFLGWQASGTLAILTLPLVLGHKLVSRCCPDSWRRQAIGPALFVLSWIFVLSWSWFDSSQFMIGYQGWQVSKLTWWQDWLVTSAVFAVACAALHQISVPPANAATASVIVELKTTDNTSADTSDS